MVTYCIFFCFDTKKFVFHKIEKYPQQNPISYFCIYSKA